MQTVETVLPLLTILETLPATVQAYILRDAAILWAAFFQGEADLEADASRAKVGQFIAAHVRMNNGPKYHGGKCACGESLPRFKCAPFFNTATRTLVCAGCYQSQLDALTAAAVYMHTGVHSVL